MRNENNLRRHSGRLIGIPSGFQRAGNVISCFKDTWPLRFRGEKSAWHVQTVQTPFYKQNSEQVKRAAEKERRMFYGISLCAESYQKRRQIAHISTLNDEALYTPGFAWFTQLQREYPAAVSPLDAYTQLRPYHCIPASI